MRGFLFLSLFALLQFLASGQSSSNSKDRREALRLATEKRNLRELDQILIWQQDFNKENRLFLDSILPFEKDSIWQRELQLYSCWIQVEEEQFTAQLDSTLLKIQKDYNQLHNKEGLARASYLYLTPQIASGNFNRVLETLRVFSSKKHTSKDSTLLSTVLQDLGYIAEKLENPQAAVLHYKGALQHSLPIDFCSSSMLSYKSIARVFNSMAMLDSAQFYFNKALSVAEECSYTGALLNTKMIVETASFKSQLGLYLLAEADFLKAREQYTRMELIGPLVRLDVLRAQNFNMAKRYTEAQSIAMNALKMSRRRGMQLQAKESLFLLSEIKKAKGYYKASISFRDRYRALNDSILDIKARESLARLEMDLIFRQQWKTDSLNYAHKQELSEVEQRERQHRQQTEIRLIFTIALAIVLFAIMLLLRIRLLRKSKNTLRLERDKSESLLLNILPAEVAQELKMNGKAVSKRFPLASVMFTDFVDFTELSRNIDPEALVSELHACFAGFDRIVDKHGLEKIKTIGDAYMAAANLTEDPNSKTMELVQAGLEMQDFIEKRAKERTDKGLWCFQMRLGIHSGPVVAGIVGNTKFQYDIWGETVNIASRMESNGQSGEVNVSEKTYNEIKHSPDLYFESRGSFAVKGAGKMHMYFIRSIKDRS